MIALYFLIKFSFVSLLHSSSKLILCFCHWRLLLTSNLIKSLAKHQNIFLISAEQDTHVETLIGLCLFCLLFIVSGFQKYSHPKYYNASCKNNWWYWGNNLTTVFGLTYTNPRPSQVKAFLFYETFLHKSLESIFLAQPLHHYNIIWKQGNFFNMLKVKTFLQRNSECS